MSGSECNLKAAERVRIPLGGGYSDEAPPLARDSGRLAGTRNSEAVQSHARSLNRRLRRCGWFFGVLGCVSCCVSGWGFGWGFVCTDLS